MIYNYSQIAEEVEIDKGKAPQPQGESVSLDLLLLFQRLLLTLLYSSTTEGDKGNCCVDIGSEVCKCS